MLFTYSSFFFFFACNKKGLLNFESERTKLVCQVNSTRCSFQKDKTPLKLLKPQFIGRIISIQIYGPYLHINFVSLEELWKYMIFYTLPWSRWNRTHKYVRCTVRDSRIRWEMSWGSIHTKITKIWTLNSFITVHSVQIRTMSNVMLLNTFRCNKRRN